MTSEQRDQSDRDDLLDFPIHTTPPLSLCLSFEGQEYDDRSDLTWASGRDDCSDEESAAKTNFSISGAQDRKQPAHPSSVYQPARASRSVSQLDQKHEFVNLKLQIAKQKEKLDILSAKLRQSQAEVEALKAERLSLIDQLALARDGGSSHDSEHSASLSMRRLNFAAHSGGSMQMILDMNSKLMAENDRLQIFEDGIRKSFESHVRFNLRSSQADKEKIKALQRKVEQLRQNRSPIESTKKHLDLSDHTNKTSPTSLEHSISEKDLDDSHMNIDTSQRSKRDIGSSLHSIPEREDIATLRRENEQLRNILRLSVPTNVKIDHDDPDSDSSLEQPERAYSDPPGGTTWTDLKESLIVEASTRTDMLIGSLHSIPEQEDSPPRQKSEGIDDRPYSPTRRHSMPPMAAQDLINESYVRRKSDGQDVPHSENDDLIVGFGDPEIRRSRSTGRKGKLWSSFSGELNERSDVGRAKGINKWIGLTNDSGSVKSDSARPSNQSQSGKSVRRNFSFSSLL
mmetsp:Transcript_34094/g.71758  ORF Transcript_34094/g.71758 Transcript_34094/m.71758 type:complete len:513 (+) Transcript_34094:17-1555(+)